MNSDSDEAVILSSEDEQSMDIEVPVVTLPIIVNEGEAVQIEGDSVSEPSSPSLLQLPSQEGKIRKAKQAQQETKCQNNSVDEDGTTCPICLDSWTNYGEHRICALKCGHLFGLNCIEQWFSQKERTCPTCKKKAVKSHIRHIYARKLVALDTSEYEQIKYQLVAVQEKNRQMQIELARGVCKEHLLLQEVACLKEEVSNLNSKVEVRERFNQRPSRPETRTSIRLYMDKSLEICKDAGCRVLDYAIKHDLIVTSMKSPMLFTGFGVRKINISTCKPTTFIPIHTKSIRDLSIHPENSWLLSVSLDKTARITDVTSNNSIGSYTDGTAPLWACCWDLQDLNTYYIGSQQGSVSKLDLRYMAKPLSIYEVPGDMSPVVSIAPLRAGNTFAHRGGIVLCKLNSLWVFEIDSECLPLGIEGPFISMKYQNSTNHLLLSTRANSQFQHTRHLLCTIEHVGESNLLCNIVHSFSGSSTQKYMSRSCFVEDISDSYVAAHQESNRSVFLWSIRSGQKVGSVPAREPVLDLCSFGSDNSNFVVALTEKKMEFFKFV